MRRRKRKRKLKKTKLKDEGGREKVDTVNEVECWQRIISMTSNGVVISRCFSPSCHGLRVVRHPPRDCINSSPSPPPPPTSHLHLTLSSVLSSSSHLIPPSPRHSPFPSVDVVPPEAQLPETNEACRRRV